MAIMSDLVLISASVVKSPHQVTEKGKAVSDQGDKCLHTGEDILDKF